VSALNPLSCDGCHSSYKVLPRRPTKGCATFSAEFGGTLEVDGLWKEEELMFVRTCVLDELGGLSFRGKTKINALNLMLIAESKEEIAREKRVLSQ